MAALSKIGILVLHKTGDEVVPVRCEQAAGCLYACTSKPTNPPSPSLGRQVFTAARTARHISSELVRMVELDAPLNNSARHHVDGSTHYSYLAALDEFLRDVRASRSGG